MRQSCHGVITQRVRFAIAKQIYSYKIELVAKKCNKTLPLGIKLKANSYEPVHLNEGNSH
jgi:hypothetical protein